MASASLPVANHPVLFGPGSVREYGGGRARVRMCLPSLLPLLVSPVHQRRCLATVLRHRDLK